MASIGIVGMLGLSDSLAASQLVVICSLLLSALLLSYVRKHERQQFGIYRNQNFWIDANLDAIIDIHHRAKGEAG